MGGMAFNKKTLADVDVSGQRIFMRVDFNVPQDKKDPTKITNTQRIDAAIPTIKDLLANGAKSIVCCSHLGRPDGSKVDKFSMAPVAKVFEAQLGSPVTFLADCCGPETEAACADPAPGRCSSSRTCVSTLRRRARASTRTATRSRRTR